MIKLRPFFYYLGGKWRLTPKYPVSMEETIIEPFAGSAGYSVRNYQKNIILNDLNPSITGLWKYLISVKSSEILKIPENIKHVDDLVDFPQETKWLVGFWLQPACSGGDPALKPSSWMKTKNKQLLWGSKVKERIAFQVEHIRHWKVSCKDYSDLLNPKATWFIDPPYQWKYLYGKYSYIDYEHLGKYVLNRNGQSIVCEEKGADWLPFTDLITVAQGQGLFKGLDDRTEVIYTGENYG